MRDELPQGENFSTAWLRLLALELKVVFVNTLITNRGNYGSMKVNDDVTRFILEVALKGAIPFSLGVVGRLLQILPQLILEGTSTDYREIDDLFFSILQSSGVSVFKDSLDRILKLLSKGHPTGHVKNVQEYNKLFPQMQLPEIAINFQEDGIFAYMRVAGYNPVMIQRVNHLGDRFPVTESQYQVVVGSDDSLAAAGEEGRLYIADYGILEG